MHVIILADIEGSSGCWHREAAASMTRAWRRACWEMTADVRVVIKALKQAGVDRITIHDFHRSGYNLIPQWMPEGCRLVSGYQAGPVPGLGHPDDADVLVMTGMHAPSGSHGFLAHTLTSRVAALYVNGRLISEAELFSASLASYGIRPIFLSGCPVTCEQAAGRIRGLHTYPIDKSEGEAQFDPEKWREGLADAVATAIKKNSVTEPYGLNGPFTVRMVMRDGPSAAAKLARRWRLARRGETLSFECHDVDTFYNLLLSICYMTPLLNRYRSIALKLYAIWGYVGQRWVRTLHNSNVII